MWYRIGLLGAVCGLAVLFGWGLFICRGHPSLSSSYPPKAWHPAPEYAPTETILVSELLFAPKYQGITFARALLATGVRLFVLKSDATTVEQGRDFLQQIGFTAAEMGRVSVVNIAHDSPWIRDFGPVPLIDTVPLRSSSLRLADFNYRIASGLNDFVPYQLAMFIDASVEHMPLALDGGNFLTDGSNCLMAGDFVDTLAMKSDDNYASVIENIKEIMIKGMGCRDVLILQNAPHQHIDMWLKLTDAHHGVISVVRPETLKLLKESGNMEAYGEMLALRTSLEKLALSLSSRYQLLEVPLPVVYRNVFRNYTNAVLVNGHALVPQYRKSKTPAFDYPDESLTPLYEEEVQKVYKQLGFKVTFVDADALIADGGALHCATGHLPIPSSR